jgi:6-phosphogluconate dehydrogenase
MEYDIGLVGLGVMGHNFLLNIADHGFSAAGYNRDEKKIRALLNEKTSGRRIWGTESIPALVGSLKKPRTVLILVSAGGAVDAVIDELIRHLDKGDLVIDGGNSHFSDTDRRDRMLSEKGFLFMGMGISGGEEGARRGPSLMPGGSREGYLRVESLLRQTAAKVDGDPCVAYLGPGSAGHYVKMVHNGIEYGLMQLIAETYDLLERGFGFSMEDLERTYGRWSESELSGFLMEVTARIMKTRDEQTASPLLQLILDEACEKGTGRWTASEAMDQGVPLPTIQVAVSMRHLSCFKSEREQASKNLHGPSRPPGQEKEAFVGTLQNALYAAMIITYGQGFALLHHASQNRSYGLDMERVARIWRGGCIIRAALLDKILSAYGERSNLANLLLDPVLAGEFMCRQSDLRKAVSTAVALGIPCPALMSSLAYFDAYRSPRLPVNLIQAQRDFFGSHTYRRVDCEGDFHTDWGNRQDHH